MVLLTITVPNRTKDPKPIETQLFVITDTSNDISEDRVLRLRRDIENMIKNDTSGTASLLGIGDDAESVAHIKWRKSPLGPYKCNNWTQDCRKYARERRNDSLAYGNQLATINNTLDSLLRNPEMDRSPILETLYRIETAPNLLRSKTVGKSSNQIVIISDMLQHSPALSLYDSVPTFEEVKGTIGWHVGIPTEMQGFLVSIFHLNRCTSEGGTIQRRQEFTKFWDDYFIYVAGDKAKWTYFPISDKCP